MRIYVVVGVCQGVVSEVKGFLCQDEAEMELAALREQYGIVPKYEEESESDVQLHEVEVDARPVSVIVRRQIW